MTEPEQCGTRIKPQMVGHIYPKDDHGRQLMIAEVADPFVGGEILTVREPQHMFVDLRRMARAVDASFPGDDDG